MNGVRRDAVREPGRISPLRDAPVCLPLRVPLVATTQPVLVEQAAS